MTLQEQVKQALAKAEFYETWSIRFVIGAVICAAITIAICAYRVATGA